MTGCSLAYVLLAVSFATLLAVAIWTRGLVPIIGREFRKRGETYDHERAAKIPSGLLIAAILGCLISILYLRIGSC